MDDGDTDPPEQATAVLTPGRCEIPPRALFRATCPLIIHIVITALTDDINQATGIEVRRTTLHIRIDCATYHVSETITRTSTNDTNSSGHLIKLHIIKSVITTISSTIDTSDYRMSASHSTMNN